MSLVMEAMEVLDAGGQEAVTRWYASLTPEQRLAFQAEYDQWAAQLRDLVRPLIDAMDGFSNALNGLR